MNAIRPVLSSPFWCYLNPVKVLKFVLSVFQGKKDQGVLVCKDFGGWFEVEKRANLFDLLDQTSRPYPMGKALLDKVSIVFAKTFFSDIARSGEPDEFFVDGKKMPPPKTLEEVLQRLLDVAQGDIEKVTEWTKGWNYRLKSTLYDALVSAFSEKYQLKPVCQRNDYQKVQISLDSRKNNLSCVIEGVVKKAIDDDPEMPEIVDVDISYRAEFSFDSNTGIVDLIIRFL